MEDHLHGNRKPGPLNLDIYSALLGGRPRIASREAIAMPALPLQSERRRRRRASLPVEEELGAPLLDADLRDQLSRCVAQAARVLADVRGRVVGVFQESTIGRKDRKPRPRVEVDVAARDRARDAA